MPQLKSNIWAFSAGHTKLSFINLIFFLIYLHYMVKYNNVKCTIRYPAYFWHWYDSIDILGINSSNSSISQKTKKASGTAGYL